MGYKPMVYRVLILEGVCTNLREEKHEIRTYISPAKMLSLLYFQLNVTPNLCLFSSKWRLPHYYNYWITHTHIIHTHIYNTAYVSKKLLELPRLHTIQRVLVGKQTETAS